MKKKLFIYVLIIPIILSSCIGKRDGEKDFKKKEIAPDSLREVSSGIANILKDAENIEKIVDKTYVEEIDENKLEDNKQNNEGKQGDIKEEDKKQEDKKQEDKNQGDKNQGDKKQEENPVEEKPSADDEKGLKREKSGNKEIEAYIKLEEKWENIYKEIEKVHENWNVYEAEGIKKGMTVENSDKFRNNLNKLTKSIESKNLMEVYDFGSQTLDSLHPLFGIYKDDIMGDINRLKYYTYKSYLFSLKKEIMSASKLLKESDEVIGSIRIKIGEDEKKLKLLEKSNISIDDMRKALGENSIKLNRIKRDITIRNLEDIGDK